MNSPIVLVNLHNMVASSEHDQKLLNGTLNNKTNEELKGIFNNDLLVFLLKAFCKVLLVCCSTEKLFFFKRTIFY